MIKKRSLSLIIIFMFLITFVSGSLVSAAQLNLKITGEINDFSSDVWIKTNANANSDIDSYDFRIPSSPESFAVFYSSISGLSFVVDVYNSEENPRTINLSYVTPTSQSGQINFSWNSSAITNTFNATLMYYGDDSTYTNQIGEDVNMKASSLYTNELDDETSVYMQIIIENYTAPAEEEEEEED